MYNHVTSKTFKEQHNWQSNIKYKLEEERCILSNEAHLQHMPQFQYGNKQKPNSQPQCLNQGENLPQIKHDRLTLNITPNV